VRALVLLLWTSVAVAGEPAWRYEAELEPGGRVLRVEATIAPGDGDELGVDEGAAPFLREVAIDEGGRWRPLSLEGSTFRVAGCGQRGCRLRYRFLLGEAAERLDSEVAGRVATGVIQAPPSTWLLHPLQATPGRAYHFTVATPPGLTFVSGVHPSERGYAADVSTLSDAPYSAFGTLEVTRVEVGNAILEIAFAPSK
jgi:hypothetical protein